MYLPYQRGNLPSRGAPEAGDVGAALVEGCLITHELPQLEPVSPTSPQLHTHSGDDDQVVVVHVHGHDTGRWILRACSIGQHRIHAGQSIWKIHAIKLPALVLG